MLISIAPFKHLEVSPYMSNNKMVLILDYYLTLITIVIDVAVGLVIGISAILAFASFLALDDEKRRPNNILETIRA